MAKFHPTTTRQDEADNLRVTIASRVLAAIISCPEVAVEIKMNRHAWALAEADALLAEASK